MRVGFELELKGAPVHVYPWKKTKYRKLTAKDKEEGYKNPQNRSMAPGLQNVGGNVSEVFVVMYDYYYCPIITLDAGAKFKKIMRGKYKDLSKLAEYEPKITAKMDSGFYKYKELKIPQRYMPVEQSGTMPCLEVMSSPIPFNSRTTKLALGMLEAMVKTIVLNMRKSKSVQFTTGEFVQRALTQKFKPMLGPDSVIVESDYEKETLGNLVIGGWKTKQSHAALGKIAPQISFALDLRRVHALLAHMLAESSWIAGVGDPDYEIKVRRHIIAHVLRAHGFHKMVMKESNTKYFLWPIIVQAQGLHMLLDIVTEHLWAAINGHLNETVNKQILPFLIKSPFKEIYSTVLTFPEQKRAQQLYKNLPAEKWFGDKIGPLDGKYLKKTTWKELYEVALTGKGRQDTLTDLDSWTVINCDEIQRKIHGPVIEIRHMSTFGSDFISTFLKRYMDQVAAINDAKKPYAFYKRKIDEMETEMPEPAYWRKKRRNK